LLRWEQTEGKALKKKRLLCYRKGCEATYQKPRAVLFLVQLLKTKGVCFAFLCAQKEKPFFKTHSSAEQLFFTLGPVASLASKKIVFGTLSFS